MEHVNVKAWKILTDKQASDTLMNMVWQACKWLGPKLADLQTQIQIGGQAGTLARH